MTHTTCQATTEIGEYNSMVSLSQLPVRRLEPDLDLQLCCIGGFVVAAGSEGVHV